MALYPVIMCGGAGTRLWPASRPSRPKQFIPLAGNRSLFQETALRVAPLAVDGGMVVVVAGVSHRPWILEQLDEVGLLEQVQVRLEPEAKDSAADVAAAALWTQRNDPRGVNVCVASDHHVPDEKAFRKAVIEATEGARLGRIVTLGIRPTEPSTAYGYISAQGAGLSPVAAFREKPDTASAVEFIRAGYLWNSGNFIVQANVLVEELKAYAIRIDPLDMKVSVGYCIESVDAASNKALRFVDVEFNPLEKEPGFLTYSRMRQVHNLRLQTIQELLDRLGLRTAVGDVHTV